MDLTELIEKYGVDKIEKYLLLYKTSKMSAGGSTLCILRLINEKVYKFTTDIPQSNFDDIDVGEFLECVYWFTLLPKYFN
uniref:Hypothetical 9-kDa protein n=1 Tax=Urdbean crinivirus TaxID=3078858 RepID=A0AA96SES6_9CLOS|nr:hypothetical 9-kDa protein [Urdbean crinivirus]